jgi:hypothetical protein
MTSGSPPHASSPAHKKSAHKGSTAARTRDRADSAAQGQVRPGMAPPVKQG